MKQKTTPRRRHLRKHNEGLKSRLKSSGRRLVHGYETVVRKKRRTKKKK